MSGNPAAPLLQLDRICFDAGGRRILHDISLRLGTQRKSIILGANGAGKSVLLRICHGLLEPTTGALRWVATDDLPALAIPAEERVATPLGLPPRQAMVFQKPIMLRRSALDNVRYALRLAGLSRADVDARSEDALARVGLAAFAQQPARAMSGGEQQRLALARAWALDPRFLFLDEPTASLDPSAARDIEALIQTIAAAGTRVVMTTHHLALAARMADEVVFIAAGRVLEQAPARAFFGGPATAEARAFLADESVSGRF